MLEGALEQRREAFRSHQSLPSSATTAHYEYEDTSNYFMYSDQVF